MKYVLMFCETERWLKDFEAMSEAERDQAVERVNAWMAEHAGKILYSSKLDEPHTATTVHAQDGTVTDGPFVEGKEVVSGITFVDVADLDEALRMAKSWPACPLVEVRPVAF